MQETQEHNPKRTRIIVAVAAALLIAVAALLTFTFVFAYEPTAATYDGGTVYEKDVYDRITAIKERMSGGDDNAWADFLDEEGYTPETFREYVISEMIKPAVVAAHASEVGVSREDANADEHMEMLRSQFSSDEEYQKYFADRHTTEQRYRTEYTDQETANAAYWTFYYGADISDEELLAQADDYVRTYGGAKKTYKIVIFDPEEGDTVTESAISRASKIREQIASGEITFEDAARQYSEDPDSKELGGYAGWPMIDMGSVEYVEACRSIAVGEMSEALKTPAGAWIIKVVDAIPTIDDYQGFDTLPDDIKEQIRQKAAGAKAMKEYDEWVDRLMEESNVKIAEMPKGVSYDVKK